MPEEQFSALLAEASAYFTEKLEQHGATPLGVDWNGAAGQLNRFAQLARLLPADRPFSINDVGCGYGALVEYLDRRHATYHYVGCDIAAGMVEAARQRFAGRGTLQFVQAVQPPAVAEYSVASGIFNLRQQRSDAEWLEYIHHTLDMMDAYSTHGFAFNCLTLYSDAERMRPDLYYADPCALFDRCKRLYSRQVALLHDYGLYEFTLLVRKQ
ncbi:MAG: class I SAM-dependent methyltransferase [Paludibacter sp.]